MEKNSLIRLFILKELEEKPKTGYDLISDLKEHSGGKKPSPGTIYPLLKDMHETKLISCKEDGRKKIYSLTTKGKKATAEFTQRHKTIMNEQQRVFQLFSSIEPKKNKYQLGLNLLKTPIMMNKWMRYNMDVIGELKKETLGIIGTPFDEKKAEVWRADMKKTIAMLKRLQK